jgi:electron transfer flavoprotein alpha subunit
MANKILVFIEQRNNKIKKASLEVASFASFLANQLSATAEAIVIGNEVEGLENIGGYGIDKVTFFKNENLSDYSPSALKAIVTEFALRIEADIIVIANTSLGKDLAPRVAAKLDAGLIMDSVAINVQDGEIIATRPVYAGKVLVDIKIKSEKKVITLRPNVFSATVKNDQKAEIKVVNVETVDLSTKTIGVKKSEGKIDVAEAEIIVSGGRGMKGPEHFELIEELSELLGAASGASRAVVDAGWRSHDEQVGQTGKTVSPTLYIALGISGAIQHLAGMRSSKYIVAINKDKDAPIFQVADYGIVGDLFEVLPVLIEEIKKIKS